jgi:hypothetical protein
LISSEMGLPFDDGTCPPQLGSPVHFHLARPMAFQLLRTLLQKIAS